MEFVFEPMTEPAAQAIAAWRYPAPFDVYSLSEDGIPELLDRRSPHFAVRDEHGDLVGFFAFGTAGEVEGEPAPALYGAERTVSVGLALRPDLTGQRRGLGLAFVQAGLDFARHAFTPAAFRLFVLTFNQRAIRVYERCGFERVALRHVHTIHGELDFLEMWRPA